ncbi:MAG TPA: Imm10 family immunity protein [Kofleriaceae bacterium]|nr:Imm10 family immunity protein [Kofleriaceae bacterium]
MMMLRALAVGVDDSEELQCFTLGFAEEADGSGPALMFQRAYAFDEQDIELGFDTYCLVTDSQSTTYGGIEKWQLAEGWLRLSLSFKAAEDLGVDRDLLIQFAPVHMELVRSALARILAPVEAPVAADATQPKAAKAKRAKAKRAKAKRAKAKTKTKSEARAKTKSARR